MPTLPAELFSSSPALQWQVLIRGAAISLPFSKKREKRERKKLAPFIQAIFNLITGFLQLFRQDQPCGTMADQVVSHPASELCDPSMETRGALPPPAVLFRLDYSRVSPPACPPAHSSRIGSGRRGINEDISVTGSARSFPLQPALPPSSTSPADLFD